MLRNEIRIQECIAGRTTDSLENPKITLKIASGEGQEDLVLYNNDSEYEEMKQKINRVNIERKNVNNKYMEAMMAEGMNTKEAWAKLSNILLRKNKSRIFNDPRM